MKISLQCFFKAQQNSNTILYIVDMPTLKLSAIIYRGDPNAILVIAIATFVPTTTAFLHFESFFNIVGASCYHT